jgi:hypothetical protein
MGSVSKMDYGDAVNPKDDRRRVLYSVACWFFIHSRLLLMQPRDAPIHAIEV